PDMKAAGPAIDRVKRLHDDIWSAAITANRLPSDDPATARMLLPAVDQMIRVAGVRMMSLQNHPPGAVYGLLLVLGLLCSLLVGFRMSVRLHRSWVHIVTFALVTSSVVYISLDIEYPRVGLIRFDRADRALTEVRASMN